MCLNSCSTFLKPFANDRIFNTNFPLQIYKNYCCTEFQYNLLKHFKVIFKYFMKTITFFYEYLLYSLVIIINTIQTSKKYPLNYTLQV